MKNLEITNNPELLFEETLGFKDYIIGGYRFHDNVDLIVNDLIKTTTLEKLPKKATCISYIEGKTYYVIDNSQFEFKLTDRIKSVKENSGWLHLFSDFRYRIENKKIEEFAVAENVIDYYKNIPKSEIEKMFGKADSIEIDYDYQNAELMNTIYHYEKRKIRIKFDEWERKIHWINIGNPIKKIR